MCIISNTEYSQNSSEIDKLLQKNVEKDLFIRMKNNITVKGKLKNFDQHLNISLKEGSVKSKEETKSFQEMLLRGSDILIISLSSYDQSSPNFSAKGKAL